MINKKKDEYADEQPDASLTQEKSPSGLGKTLLTSKPSDDESEDNPMKRKVGYQN